MKRGKDTLSTSSAIIEGLEDVRKGRVLGPFDTAEEMLASLKGKRDKPLSPEKRAELRKRPQHRELRADCRSL